MIWVALLLMLVAGAGLIVSIALLRDHCPPPPTINAPSIGSGPTGIQTGRGCCGRWRVPDERRLLE